MAIEHAPVWRCEQCQHRWLIEDPLKPPKWCAKCRSRKWDESGAARMGAQSPPPTFVPHSIVQKRKPAKPHVYTAPTILPGLAPLDADNRARLNKLNEAKYSKGKK